MNTRAAVLIALAVAYGCGNRATTPTPSGDQPTKRVESPTATVRTIHHELNVQLDPENHGIEIDDRISGFDTGAELRFQLHAGLTVASMDSKVDIERLADTERQHTAVPIAAYIARPATGTWPDAPRIHLRITGTIHHPLKSEAENYARSFARTPGTISERGVMLNTASDWLPDFGRGLLTFRMTVDVPGDWDVVSQGTRTAHTLIDDNRRVTWDAPDPTDDIYLIAGAFHVYESAAAAPVTAYAYLRTPDEALANRYFDATALYIAMYSELLGPYPYDKFALVENFWETGYGMPSFTLLGPRVIRFPFILHSSYPHEILHNWWGNSVFVDEHAGNWCEGLTSYLADHLIKEQRGGGVAYRRDTLKKYSNFVRSDEELSLAQFRSRHSSASEAIGYGKSLMLYHMVRRLVGDDAFVAGLRGFYDKHRFERASYDDLQAALSAASGRDLTPVFSQWVTRTGAPTLSVRAQPIGDQRVAIELEQTTDGAPYQLAVPVALTLAGVHKAHVVTLSLDTSKKRFELELPGTPTRVDVDPYFDVFRRLRPGETPPVLGEIFGADKVLIVLPASDPLLDAWTRLATTWQHNDSAVSVKNETDTDELPSDRAAWVLGANNKWARIVRDRADMSMLGRDDAYRNGRSSAMVVRHPRAPTRAVGWIASDTAAAIPGIARKLPHYGKYSYLGFAGDAPTNVAKGQWSVDDSPLTVSFVPQTKRATLPERSALVPPRTPREAPQGHH